MKNLPVLNSEGIEKQQLRERINLTRRPSLGFTLDQLAEVADRLAVSDFDRERFVKDPPAYLGQQLIAVTSGQLVETTLAQTSETVCTYVMCNVAAVVSGPPIVMSYSQTYALCVERVMVAGCKQNPTSNISQSQSPYSGFVGWL